MQQDRRGQAAGPLPQPGQQQAGGRPATLAATDPATARRLAASWLIRSASTVGRTCQSPNTRLVTARAAGRGRTRRKAAWSTPRNATSSHSTVPAGMRTVTW